MTRRLSVKTDMVVNINIKRFSPIHHLVVTSYMLIRPTPKTGHSIIDSDKYMQVEYILRISTIIWIYLGNDITVLTRLDYGSVTLNGITKRLMDRLQSVLNAAARLVNNSRNYMTAFHHFCATHWLRVPERIKFRIWPFLCSAVATRLHRTIWREIYSRQTCTDDSRRRLRSATTQRLLVRRARLRTIGDRCCTARLERPVCRHRFCTVTGHFEAALEDSSVWTIIRRTTDLVTCS